MYLLQHGLVSFFVIKWGVCRILISLSILLFIALTGWGEEGHWVMDVYEVILL